VTAVLPRRLLAEERGSAILVILGAGSSVAPLTLGGGRLFGPMLVTAIGGGDASWADFRPV
jgi:hypothetical protein